MKTLHTIRQITLLLAAAAGLHACQEPISIDLKSCAPKLVVEGAVTTEKGPYQILLSRSTDYFNPGKTRPESGARIIISDNSGHSETLHEKEPGSYYTINLRGIPGQTYNLLVETQGQSYTASSVMQDSVHIDSLTQHTEPSVYDFPNNVPSHSLICWFLDPPKQGNYYGFRIAKDHRLLRDIVRDPIMDDRLTNGRNQNTMLSDISFIDGDSVKIDLIALDKAGYDFYKTLQQSFNSGSSPFSTPPANPIGNISNGALGYFGAYSITSRSVVLE
jgi:hypothetical protein